MGVEWAQHGAWNALEEWPPRRRTHDVGIILLRVGGDGLGRRAPENGSSSQYAKAVPPLHELEHEAMLACPSLRGNPGPPGCCEGSSRVVRGGLARGIHGGADALSRQFISSAAAWR